MPTKTSKPTPRRERTESDRLLEWYDQHRRLLPWRAAPTETADPYAVWLSEVMLQQTTVAAVKSYFVNFLERWPRVEDLAKASSDDIMRAWAGLGYYSRARNLHACAKIVAAGGGRFPDSEADLLDLPGIGPYTAAAIAAIAFDRRAVVVDGNVERVIVRLHAIDQPIREVKALIRKLADVRTPGVRSGDYAQAMMDLGATICTPRKPACVICPLGNGCEARQRGLQQVLPAKSVKPERPTRFGSVFYIRRGNEVLVRTRPGRGLLGGMTEFPGSAWDETGDPDGACCPIKASYRKRLAPVEHGFTHFSLSLTLFTAEVGLTASAPGDCRFVQEAALPDEALPTLMRKVATAAVPLFEVKETA